MVPELVVRRFFKSSYLRKTITWERKRASEATASLLADVFQDFADKNNRSNGCFYLAILQGTIKKHPSRVFFYGL